MSTSSIGVAVIGAGMAGQAHASGYRSAPTVFGGGLPGVRLGAIADAYEPFAVDTAQRYNLRVPDAVVAPARADGRSAAVKEGTP